MCLFVVVEVVSNLNIYVYSAEALEPTDDEEKNARMKKRIQDQLVKLKRNAERRKQRQLAKQAALAENPVLGLIRGKREGAMVRNAVFVTDLYVFVQVLMFYAFFLASMW